jgi:hypothetical protein
MELVYERMFHTFQLGKYTLQIMIYIYLIMKELMNLGVRKSL